MSEFYCWKQDRDNDNRLKFITVRLKVFPEFDTAAHLKCYKCDKYFDNSFFRKKWLFVIKLKSAFYTDVATHCYKDWRQKETPAALHMAPTFVAVVEAQGFLQKVWGSNSTDRKVWGKLSVYGFMSTPFCETQDIPFERSVWRCWCLDGFLCWVSAHIRVGLFRTDSLSSGGGGGRKGRKCETGVFQDIVFLDRKRNANAAY